MLEFQSKDDAKSAANELKSLTKDITDGYETKVYRKILEEVRKNPADQEKKVKASLPFMHLGADRTQDSIENKHHRQSMMPPESNKGFREEIDAHARQRLFSEQVSDPASAGQVGYQSSKCAITIN